MIGRRICGNLVRRMIVAAMFLAGASYALARTNRVGLLLATFFLAFNWFGDSLDGPFARVRNQLRLRYGFYVNHMMDTFGRMGI
jgi:phosphatidylglycerophosphate synthase